MLRASMAVAVLLVLCSAVPAQEFTAKPSAITETRQQTLIEKKNFFSSGSAGLKITLLVDGPGAAGATRWGQVQITEATDDAGTDLTPKKKKSFFGNDEKSMDEINRFGMDDNKPGPFEVAIELGLPARKATKIASVKGEFKVLAGGDEKVAMLSKPKSATGKPFEDPVLKDAGITINVMKPDSDNSFTMEAKGKLDAIKSIEVLDASGEKATNGHFATGFNDTKTYSYDLKKPLDDTMSVKVTLLVNQKEVSVPFELKDVALP